MALMLVLKLGGDDNWAMCDELIPQVTFQSAASVMEWWADVGNNNEAEGFLVHLWLLRHGKASTSILGERHDLFERVKRDVPNTSSWMT